MTVALQHQGYSTKALLLHTVHSFVHSFRHWLLHEPLYEKGGLFSLSLGCRPLGFNKIILKVWKQWSATEMWLSCDGVLVMAILSLLSLLTPVIRWRIRHLVPELWPMVEACLNMLEDTWSWRADTTTGSREVPAKPPQDWCLCACAYGFNLSSYLHLRHLAWAEKGKHDFSCACAFTTLCRCCSLPALTLLLSRSRSHFHSLSLLDPTISEYLMTTRFLPSACFLFHKCPGLHDNLSQLWKDGQKVYRERELDKDTQIFYMHTYTPSHVLDVHCHS